MDSLRLQIEYVDSNLLKPNPRNPRTHSKRQLGALADSIKRRGMITPVGVDENNILIYGHARVKAAKAAGLSQVPIVRLTHLSADERRAYLIADNQLCLAGGWDRELLALELKELEALEFDLPALGFTLAEVDAIFDEAHDGRIRGRKENDDRIPAPDEVAVTRLGDLWQLGHHRLLCGDARSADDYQRLLGSERVDLIFTDPPYNVPIDGHVCGSGAIRHREFAMAVGEMTREDFTAFLIETLGRAAERCRDGAIAYVCMDWRHLGELESAGRQVFNELKNVCVWNKTNAGMGTFYRSKHEMIFVFKVGTAAHTNSFGLGDTGRYRTNVWDYPGVNGSGRGRTSDLALHPTVKPVALVTDAIKDCSERGNVVLDAFGGAGTTLLAAQRSGRLGRVMEYDPIYCDVIIRRFESVTGKQAVLAQTGANFEDVCTERLGTVLAG